LALMSEDMSLAAAAGGESLIAPFSSALEGLFSGVRAQVLLQGTLLIPSLAASVKWAYEGLLASVDASVDQEMSWAKEGLSTSGVVADMGFSSLMVSLAVVNKVPLRGELPVASRLLASEGLWLVIVHCLVNIEATLFHDFLMFHGEHSGSENV